MAGHDWVTEHALYFDMMGVAWGYTYANIHRENNLKICVLYISYNPVKHFNYRKSGNRDRLTENSTVGFIRHELYSYRLKKLVKVETFFLIKKLKVDYMNIWTLQK